MTYEEQEEGPSVTANHGLLADRRTETPRGTPPAAPTDRQQGHRAERNSERLASLWRFWTAARTEVSDCAVGAVQGPRTSVKVATCVVATLSP
jgi:hypothetical protein